MKRFSILSYPLALGFLLGSFASATGEEANQRKEESNASTLNATVWGALVFASENEVASVASQKVGDLSEEMRKSLGKVFRKQKYSEFVLLGQHTQGVIYSDFENWVVPSNDFNLVFEMRERGRNGELNLLLKFWQNDTVLLKTDVMLKQGSPLILAGPAWRGGQLVFVLLMQ